MAHGRLDSAEADAWLPDTLLAMLLPRVSAALALTLALLAQPAGGASRRCRKADGCESCTAAGCGWCPDLDGGRCLERSSGKAECGGRLQRSCLSELNPKRDTDRVSQTIDRAVTAGRHADSTPANGRRIAAALDLRVLMQRIAEAFPTSARFLSNDPPILYFEKFLSTQECDAVRSAGEASLQPSIGALNTEQTLTRAVHTGRSSHNAWCTGSCAANPTIKRIEAKIANVTGFSFSNMEPLQILRYTESQEYQAHLDFIPQQASQPAGPRVFTFFLYLNDVPPGGGGTTWFPHAEVNSSVRPVSNPELNAFYTKYNGEKAERMMHGGMAEMCCSKPLAPAREHFRGVGLRVVPKKGAAILWPNVDLDDVYVSDHMSTLSDFCWLICCDLIAVRGGAGTESTRGRSMQRTRWLRE